MREGREAEKRQRGTQRRRRGAVAGTFVGIARNRNTATSGVGSSGKREGEGEREGGNINKQCPQLIAQLKTPSSQAAEL